MGQIRGNVLTWAYFIWDDQTDSVIQSIDHGLTLVLTSDSFFSKFYTLTSKGSKIGQLGKKFDNEWIEALWLFFVNFSRQKIMKVSSRCQITWFLLAAKNSPINSWYLEKIKACEAVPVRLLPVRVLLCVGITICAIQFEGGEIFFETVKISFF